MKLPRRRKSVPLPLVALVGVLSLAAGSGCSGGYALVRRDLSGLAGQTWFSPAQASDREALDRWAAAVGPSVAVGAASTTGPRRVDQLIAVSWNTALGTADTVGFIREVQRSCGPHTELVVLLQEVFRGGPEVPRLLASSASFASRLGGADARGDRAEIEDVAARTGLNLYYVPSMRNGDPSSSDEDRGNAILSSLELSELSAVELPFERQRRVAVAATVRGLTLTGRPWRLRVLSAHLDNMVGLRRMWFAGGEFARARQARALLDHLNDEPAAVLGADLNTWFGFRDRGYLVAASAFPDTRVVDRRATFRGLLRLDHLFFRVPDGWRADFRRAEDDFGSDHHPLVAQLRLPA